MAESRGRVLIVDDEVFFREAMEEILAAAGFQTGTAEDGQSALAKLADASIGPQRDLAAVVQDRSEATARENGLCGRPHQICPPQ